MASTGTLANTAAFISLFRAIPWTVTLGEKRPGLNQLREQNGWHTNTQNQLHP